MSALMELGSVLVAVCVDRTVSVGKDLQINRAAEENRQRPSREPQETRLTTTQRNTGSDDRRTCQFPLLNR